MERIFVLSTLQNELSTSKLLKSQMASHVTVAYHLQWCHKLILSIVSDLSQRRSTFEGTKKLAEISVFHLLHWLDWSLY